MIAFDVSIIEINASYQCDFLKQKAYPVGYFDSIILLNLGTSSNFHMNNFTVLRLTEDYIC